jgi:hypothetical protein
MNFVAVETAEYSRESAVCTHLRELLRAAELEMRVL